MREPLNNQQLEYKGEKQPKPGERDAKTQEPLYPYFPSEELVEAVNLAIYLERPLLLKGEPGCGKTRLATAVAYELHLDYQRWNIKSTSKAEDGLYTYDAVRRLRDAQLAALGRLSEKQIQEIDQHDTYIHWGALGEAFQNKQRTVVLIDEIDKADIDFPNDLLQELDEQCFEVKETKKTINAHAAPIVIITSNDEKELPDAFLRRCLFHYVEFPKPDRLIKIIKAFFPESSDRLVNVAIDRFLTLRKEMQKDKGDVGKKVSTSELIDWMKALSRYPQLEVLKKLEEGLLYPGVLLKSWEDYRIYPERLRSKIV